MERFRARGEVVRIVGSKRQRTSNLGHPLLRISLLNGRGERCDILGCWIGVWFGCGHEK